MEVTFKIIIIVFKKKKRKKWVTFTKLYSYETANGIKAEETGTLKKTTDKDNPEVIVAQGSYSYTDPDGKLISVTYVADDEGKSYGYYERKGTK